MRVIIIITMLFAFACKNNKNIVAQRYVNDYKTYLLSVLKRSDSTAALDSFSVVRIDTITQKRKYLQIFFDINENQKELEQQADLNIKLYQSNLNVLRLSAGLDNSLYEHYKSKVDDSKKDLDEIQAKMKNSLFLMDSFNKLSIKADSTKPVGYQATCFYQLRKSDASVKKDTAYLTLNVDKNVVERSEFYSKEGKN